MRRLFERARFPEIVGNTDLSVFRQKGSCGTPALAYKIPRICLVPNLALRDHSSNRTFCLQSVQPLDREKRGACSGRREATRVLAALASSLAADAEPSARRRATADISGLPCQRLYP